MEKAPKGFFSFLGVRTEGILIDGVGFGDEDLGAHEEF